MIGLCRCTYAPGFAQKVLPAARLEVNFSFTSTFRLGIIELEFVTNHFNGFHILNKSRTCGLKTIEMVPGITKVNLSPT